MKIFEDKIFGIRADEKLRCQNVQFLNAYYSLAEPTRSMTNMALRRVWQELSEMV